MQGWLPACSPTVHGPLSFQKSPWTDLTPGPSSPSHLPALNVDLFPLSPSGRELGPARPAAGLAVALCSTCRVVRPHLVPFPFRRRGRAAGGAALSHPHRVLPPWLHRGRLPPLPMGFQDHIFQAQPGLRSLYPGHKDRGHYLSPRGTSVPHRPSMGCSCTFPRLGGSCGRRPTGHTTWTARVNDSVTRLVTTSALPRL